ncbi:MAG: TonB-dependent receptor [Steroidobacteraceae bacterium]
MGRTNQRHEHSRSIAQRLLRASCGLSICVALHPLVAAGQSEGSSRTSDALEEIVVTAQKREQSLNDVGLTVNAIRGDDLANLQITDSQDLANIVPALNVSKGLEGTPVYTMRGVGFNSTNLGAQPTVSIYMDEAGLSYGPLTQGPLFDLERVEVLKGPQGTLFGQNSTGGAINYIAAKPTDTLTGGVRLDYGRFNAVEAEGFISGPLTETLSARLSATGARSDGWQDSYLGDDKIGETKKEAARLLLDWKPNADLKVSLNLNGWRDKSDNQVPQFLVAIPRSPGNELPAIHSIPAAPDNDRAADWGPDNNYRRDNDMHQAVLRADWDVAEDLTLTSLSNYAKVNIDSTYDWDGTSFAIGRVNVSGDVEVFSQELRLSGQRGPANFVVGANYQTDDSFESQLQFFPQASAANGPLGSFTGADNRGKQSNDSIAGFANIDWALTDQVTLIAGGRYTEETHRNQACTADDGSGTFAAVINTLTGLFTGTPGTIQPGACTTLDATFANAPFEKQKFDENSFSWRVGANFKPMDDVLLYSLITRGFKSGSYPIFGATSRDQFEPVVKEKVTAYEIGAKAGLLDQRVQLNGAVYYYDYADKQLYTNTVDPIFGFIPVLRNVPTAQAYGAELELMLRPANGFTLRSAVAYTHTRVGPFSDYNFRTEVVDLRGNAFNYAPKWTGSADAEYRWSLTGATEAFVGADVSYTSDTYADLARSQELYMDSYTLLGARAGVTLDDGRVQVMAFGRNLSNEYYWTNANYALDAVLRIAGTPRTYGISASYKF